MKQPEALRLADYLNEIRRYPDVQKELLRLHQFEIAFTKYLEKTEWVQETAKYYELGMDRADVLKQRIDRLHEVNQMLLNVLNIWLEQYAAEPMTEQQKMDLLKKHFNAKSVPSWFDSFITDIEAAHGIKE